MDLGADGSISVDTDEAVADVSVHFSTVDKVLH
jgi:hypothetical protein